MGCFNTPGLCCIYLYTQLTFKGIPILPYVWSRDPVLPLNTLLGPKMRYLGNDIIILSLEAMKNMFEIAATNLKIARKKGNPENNSLPTKLQPGDTVLVQNHTKGPFDPKYVEDY